MNYIEQINNFWAYSEELNLNSGDISVYFALLKYNNSLGWIKSFRCDYGVICQYSGVSKNKFYKSLESLVDNKLITYEKGVRNVLKPKIVILQLKNRKGTIKEQSEEQHEEQKGNLYKLLNFKTIKLIECNHSIINSNLNNWVDDFKKTIKPEEDSKKYSQAVHECFNYSLNYFPKELHPKKKESWLDTLEKLNRIDGYSFDEIKTVIKKTREDPFWSKNFLSIKKLRNSNPDGIKYYQVFKNQNNEQRINNSDKSFGNQGTSRVGELEDFVRRNSSPSNN